MAGQTFTDEEMRLAKFFVQREGDEILDSIRDINFLAEGIIDSLDFVALAVFVEKEFGKKLDLTQEDTFVAMCRFESLLELVDVPSGETADRQATSE